jgi:hypothetical protein
MLRILNNILSNPSSTILEGLIHLHHGEVPLYTGTRDYPSKRLRLPKKMPLVITVPLRDHLISEDIVFTLHEPRGSSYAVITHTVKEAVRLVAIGGDSAAIQSFIEPLSNNIASPYTIVKLREQVIKQGSIIMRYFEGRRITPRKTEGAYYEIGITKKVRGPYKFSLDVKGTRGEKHTI